MAKKAKKGGKKPEPNGTVDKFKEHDDSNAVDIAVTVHAAQDDVKNGSIDESSKVPVPKRSEEGSKGTSPSQNGSLEQSLNGVDNKGQIDSESYASLQSIVDQQQTEIQALTKKLDSIKLESGSESDTTKELQAKLQQAEQARDESEQQYQNLLGKISNIKSTLGERLKADANELASCREIIEALEAEKRQSESSIEALQREVITASKESDGLSQELSKLRKEYQESIRSWEREKDGLIQDRRKAADEAEKSRSVVQDLEVAILEERALIDNFNTKVSELDEQVVSQANYAERFRQERDSLQSSLNQCQEALKSNAQDYSKKLESLESDNQQIKTKLEETQLNFSEISEKYEQSRAEAAKLGSLESESKEKNLLIGKLRHEAVILNEHLTKALRMIKKDSEGETVDKQLITNLILSFVAIPRGDSKKFEVLRLISNYLGWDEDQKAQAGLTRSSVGSQPNLGVKSPVVGSPTRSFSSTSLAGQDEPSSGGFMGLFAEFLERESKREKN